MSRRKRDQRQFVGMHKQVIYGSPEWASLSPAAKDLYLLAKGKWKGPGEGDEVTLSYRTVLDKGHRGLRSNKRIASAFRELAEGGRWLERAAPGGLLGNPQLWRLTFKVDDFPSNRRGRR